MLTLLLFAAGAASCAPVPGATPLLRSGTVVLLGEVHGTAEGPEAVSKLACLALEEGLHVTVALEIPVAEREGVARYLAGGGARELLSGAFWSRDFQDGRSSAAMLDLLSALRALRETGANLDVLLIDDPGAEGGRDRFMADTLAGRMGEAPAHLLLALVGNLHNRLTRGTRFDPDYEPMGLLLTEQRPGAAIESLQITYGRGSAWVCTGSEAEDCGTRELSGREGVAGIEMYDDESSGAFTGRYHVERITASPPARAAR